jgi:hypothetical protein
MALGAAALMPLDAQARKGRGHHGAVLGGGPLGVAGALLGVVVRPVVGAVQHGAHRRHHKAARPSRSRNAERKHQRTPSREAARPRNRQADGHHPGRAASAIPAPETSSGNAARFTRAGDSPRGASLAASEAWANKQPAAFVAWSGALFWPYVYSDMLDYALWPEGYAPDYWSSAYDEFFDGFWEGAPGDKRAQPRGAKNASSAQTLCAQPASGITAWPFDAIAAAITPNAAQTRLLDALKAASQRAAAALAAACPQHNAVPQNPPARLQLIAARVQASLAALRIVKAPLEQFYAALGPEQKERFDTLGPNFRRATEMAAAAAAATKRETTASAATDGAGTAGMPPPCDEARPGLTAVPVDRIEKAAHPVKAQEAALKQLEHAAERAVKRLQKICPDWRGRTPPERLAMMEQRMQAMADAAWILQTPLDRFYSLLNDQQKTRVNHLTRD